MQEQLRKQQNALTLIQNQSGHDSPGGLDAMSAKARRRESSMMSVLGMGMGGMRKSMLSPRTQQGTGKFALPTDLLPELGKG